MYTEDLNFLTIIPLSLQLKFFVLPLHLSAVQHMKLTKATRHK